MQKIYDATYTLSELCRAQRGDLIFNGLRLKVEGKELDKTIYDTETLHVITQFWNKHKSRLVLNEQDVFIYKRTYEEKVSFDYDAIVLPRLYQVEVIFKAHDQEPHQGVNRVTARIQQRFIWPGMHSAIKKWIKSCHVCQIKKGKAKIGRFPLKKM